MQKITLGGDRLGSGNKIKVELPGYERSTHDLSYLWRSTMSPGTLVPFMSELALPGDTWDIDLNAMVNTHPALGPLFGTMKLQLDIFLAPLRLYNSKLHNNQINVGRKMSNVKLPQIRLHVNDIDDTMEINNAQINPSCILKYLGISGVGVGPVDTDRDFNAVPFLAYWEIYKNYYANKQEEIGAVIHTPLVAVVDTVDAITVNAAPIPEIPGISLVELTGANPIIIDYTGTAPLANQIFVQLQYAGWKSLNEVTSMWNDDGVDQITAFWNQASWGIDYAINWRYAGPADMNTVRPEVTTFPLQNIDDIRTEILAFNSDSDPYVINDGTLAPYQWVTTHVDGRPYALSSQEGLAIKTYQSDLFNAWLSEEWISGAEGINEITAVSTVGDQFTIDSLIIARKVYDMMNRIAVSGGTYKDWLDVVYKPTSMWQAESPIYYGGLTKEIIFQEVISNSQSEATSAGGTTQPLGTLAGKGTLGSKHKGGHVNIKVDEPGYIIGLVSITPRIDYSQGNKWDTQLLTMDDLHKPAMDQIGFQDLSQEQLAWWTTQFGGGIWSQKFVGKQPSWTQYTTAVNRTYGNFAISNNEMFMTLNRRYEYGGAEGEILDMTTYIDPAKFNFIFADPSIDAQNFWMQIGVDATVRRLMSAKAMPHL